MAPYPSPGMLGRFRSGQIRPQAALEAFAGIVRHWRLDDATQAAVVGFPDAAVLARALAGQAPLDHNQRHRIYHLIRMAIALGAIFPQGAEAERIWLTTKRRALAGVTVLDKLRSPDMDTFTEALKFLDLEYG